jgi:hypothetical protein
MRRLILAIALLTACTSTAPAGERSTPIAMLQSPTASPSSQACVFVRACDDSVFGELGPGWGKDSVVIGPIAFVGLRGYRHGPDRYFQPRNGRYRALKVLAVVPGDRVITVSIADRNTDQVRMMHDPSAWGDRTMYPLEAGDTITVFGPFLHHRSTQFNGAFLVTGRTCATLEYRSEMKDPCAGWCRLARRPVATSRRRAWRSWPPQPMI